jgi:hypothetical protein
MERGSYIDFAMKSVDGAVSINVAGHEADSWPASSCFASLERASAFFEGGNLGYSVTRDGGQLDGLLLRTLEWRVKPLAVASVYSSFFADSTWFPKSSIEFDHALIMRDVRHEWHQAEDLYPLSSPPDGH